MGRPVPVKAHFGPRAQKIYKLPRHWQIEINNQIIWLSPAYSDTNSPVDKPVLGQALPIIPGYSSLNLQNWNLMYDA
ncbi:hypothetical protein TNCV_648261 [Trichonephila clavipes]|uniref:Uncharacterized protein n=1 Tax=Trichonephila clavipes TaxID=2585209 RepID=A0A8X6VND3_TRICX|nr:hypothetical protein TNCV_648261 [Trichonephila clavipes]